MIDVVILFCSKLVCVGVFVVWIKEGYLLKLLCEYSWGCWEVDKNFLNIIVLI